MFLRLDLQDGFVITVKNLCIDMMASPQRLEHPDGHISDIDEHLCASLSLIDILTTWSIASGKSPFEWYNNSTQLGELVQRGELRQRMHPSVHDKGVQLY